MGPLDDPMADDFFIPNPPLGPPPSQILRTPLVHYDVT